MTGKERAKTQGTLAKALGISRQRVGQLIKSGKIPPMPKSGWDTGAVKRGLEKQNPHAQRTKTMTAPGTENVSVYATLSDATDALEVARAAMQLASRSVGAAAEGGALRTADLDSLKKTLEELRRYEKAAIDLARERGQLIERTTAIAVCGELAARGVRVLDAVCNDLALQLEIWWGDDAFAELETSERTAVVRSWFRDMSRTARQTEAEQVDRMIKSEVDALGERKGAA